MGEQGDGLFFSLTRQRVMIMMYGVLILEEFSQILPPLLLLIQKHPLFILSFLFREVSGEKCSMEERRLRVVVSSCAC